jgi:hypothetical protein
MEDGITADLEYATITADWDITDNLNFLALVSSGSRSSARSSTSTARSS